MLRLPLLSHLNVYTRAYFGRSTSRTSSGLHESICAGVAVLLDRKTAAGAKDAIIPVPSPNITCMTK